MERVDSRGTRSKDRGAPIATGGRRDRTTRQGSRNGWSDRGCSPVESRDEWRSIHLVKHPDEKERVALLELQEDL